MPSTLHPGASPRFRDRLGVSPHFNTILFDAVEAMRILYVSQYFPPEMGAPAARVYELSREWVRRGHQVTVLTAFPHHPKGIKLPRDRHVLSRRESVDGIDVIRTYVFAAANKGTVKRMISYASFMLSAMTIGRLRVTRPDVVIATSPQLLCGLAGYVVALTLERAVRVRGERPLAGVDPGRGR